MLQVEGTLFSVHRYRWCVRAWGTRSRGLFECWTDVWWIDRESSKNDPSRRWRNRAWGCHPTGIRELSRPFESMKGASVAQPVHILTPVLHRYKKPNEKAFSCMGILSISTRYQMQAIRALAIAKISNFKPGIDPIKQVILDRHPMVFCSLHSAVQP